MRWLTETTIRLAGRTVITGTLHFPCRGIYIQYNTRAVDQAAGWLEEIIIIISPITALQSVTVIMLVQIKYLNYWQMVHYVICSNQPFSFHWPSLSPECDGLVICFLNENSKWLFPNQALKVWKLILNSDYYGVNVNPKENDIKNVSSNNYHSYCGQYNDSLLMTTNICSLPQSSL